MNIVLIIAGVIAGIAAIYYFMSSRVRADMDKEIEEAADAIPGVTREEAIAEAAAEAAAEELKKAQEAERQALVAEQADIVRALETRLKSLESAAILQPTDPGIIKETEEAEARAEAERAELEKRWTEALNRAEVAMIRAEEAAIVASGAHLRAKRNIGIWELDVTQLERALVEAERFLAQEQVVGIGKRKIGEVWYTREEYEAFKRKRDILATTLATSRRSLEAARNAEIRTKTDAYSAISSANLAVERVLTIIADLRLLGILLALASRVDGIAKATRTKLAELEAKMGAR